MISDEMKDREIAAARDLLTLSNWGKWGEDDERGALNYVTPASVRRALAAVKKGEFYPLGQEIRGGRSGQYHALKPYGTGPLVRGRPQPLLFFAFDGGDWAAGARHEKREQMADDTIFMPIHGTGTHVDALSHSWYDNVMFNSFSGNLVRSYGAIRLGIENFGGILTKGILLDIAKYRGVARLEATDYITEEDVIGCCEQNGLEIESGDAVLIHTGWPTIWLTDPESYSGLQPGVGASAALYLARKEICVLGADNSGVQPFSGFDPETNSHMEDPRAEYAADLHEALLRNLGIYLIEMLDLAKLAEAGVYEFLLSLSPLALKGATGSPINPLAVA